MHLGFNTNVHLGDIVVHVQTEDRGFGHPYIDTTVYVQGRVLHRRTTNYHDLFGPGGVSEAELQQRVEHQHRSVVEELRSGALKVDLRTPAAVPAGIQVKLLNPASWFAAGTATLQVQVVARGTCAPVGEANVEVMLEGTQTPARIEARTNPEGHAEVSFAMPRLGPGGGTLVIRAASPSGEDEVRFQLKPKHPVPAPPTPAK